MQNTNFEEGNGKIKNMLGAFITDYKGNKLRVGTGFTNKEKSYFWSNKNNLKGRVIEIKYSVESRDKDKNYSLQFPTFVRLREENKEVSYA